MNQDANKAWAWRKNSTLSRWDAKARQEADFLTLFFMMHTAWGLVSHKEVFPKSQDFCWVLLL